MNGKYSIGIRISIVVLSQTYNVPLHGERDLTDESPAKHCFQITNSHPILRRNPPHLLAYFYKTLLLFQII